VISPATARRPRLDPYVDGRGGWHPASAGGDERSFVERVRADVGGMGGDGAIAGSTVGKAAVLARIHDEGLQTGKEHVEWPARLLRASLENTLTRSEVKPPERG